jgi:hypothetical protein
MSATEQDRRENGDFDEVYKDKDFVEAVRKHEPANTPEVKEEVGCTHNQANTRLKKLKDAGEIQGKKLKSWTWWIEEGSA